MMFAIIFSLRTILFSSTGIILFVFRPLLGKNSFMDFQNFLLSEILVTLISLKHFSLVWGSNLTKKIPLLITIVPVFIRTLFVKIIFEPGPKHYRFSERFSHKGIILKTENFYFNWGDLVYNF